MIRFEKMKAFSFNFSLFLFSPYYLELPPFFVLISSASVNFVSFFFKKEHNIWDGCFDKDKEKKKKKQKQSPDIQIKNRK